MDAAEQAERRPVVRTARVEDRVRNAGQQRVLEDDRAALDAAMLRMRAIPTFEERNTMSEPLTETEIETLRKGAMGAGLLVSVSDRGFFDTFKEAGALAKHVAAARGTSESAVVKHVAEGHGTGFGLTSRPEEIESGTLDALRSSVQLLEAKAPDELAAYRAFVLDLAKSVAAAAPGGDTAESGAVTKIEAALGS